MQKTMMTRVGLMAVGAMFAAASFAQGAATAAAPQPSLRVGSPAPKIEASKWVKGKEVKEFKKGEVYVVEFWATWCGPCKESIPHLTEVAKKYAGKATVIGVSVWENDPETEKTEAGYMPKVEAFVKDMGAKMDYVVAADTWDGKVADAWMKASNQPGIPTAFIVNRDGTVVWIGHPMAGLDEALGKVIDGSFNVEEEQKRAEEAAREAEKQAAEMAELFGPFEEALGAGDYEAAVKEIDKIIVKKPDMEIRLAGAKFDLMMTYDETGAYGYARKLKDGVYKDQPMALNSIAWSMVDDETPKAKPDYKLALEISTAAVKMMKEDSYSKAMVMDTQALAYFKTNELDKAIEIQTKAVEMAKKFKDEADSEGTIAEMEARLADFKAKKG